MSTLPRLQAHFGGNAVELSGDDAALQATFAGYFRHCSPADNAPVVASYQVITGAAERLQLWCNRYLVRPNATRAELTTFLSQDVITQLIAHCRTQPVFHAAGLSSGDCGVLLCGGTGSGKSTLAARLVARGFGYLTDEVVAISTDGAEMRGFTRPLMLKSGSAFIYRPLLSTANEQQPIQFGGDIVGLDPTRLHPDCVRVMAQPRMLIFIKYSAHAPFKAQPLSSGESVFHLLQVWVNAYNLPEHGLKIVAQLAQRTTGYRLTYSDAGIAADWITHNLPAC